jgi:hypothetical protein
MDITRNNCSFVSLAVLLALFSAVPVHGWGSSSKNNNGNQLDQVYFGNKFAQDWLYSSNKLSFKIDGCVWGNVADSENVGCLEDESDEGTTNWYMMANCKRPQVAFSVYSAGNCNSGNFEGSVSLMITCNQINTNETQLYLTLAF